MKQGFANFGNITKQLCKGFGATLSIFFLTMIISLPLGLLVTFGRMTKITPIRWITKIYISIMRGTPLMLQLLVVFFGPYYLFGIKLASTVPHYRFIAVIIGFSLNYAAYFAEIYRSGIESIPAGQREAAKLLGYTRGQTFAKIILPQMIKRVMPPVTNEIITLVKDTSLAFVLSYMEMFTMAQQIAATLTNVMPIFVAGVFYYIFNYLVAFVMELIEKKLNYYQ
ncbi:amino acid ABC transporter permease [Jutongia hominis]|nr:amino acid ABC transporter permease [Jutongia hominis]MEE0290420.1 amino acid ABC transporter permease [Lachnospiraceae bacterium]